MGLGECGDAMTPDWPKLWERDKTLKPEAFGAWGELPCDGIDDRIEQAEQACCRDAAMRWLHGHGFSLVVGFNEWLLFGAPVRVVHKLGNFDHDYDQAVFASCVWYLDARDHVTVTPTDLPLAFKPKPGDPDSWAPAPTPPCPDCGKPWSAHCPICQPP